MKIKLPAPVPEIPVRDTKNAITDYVNKLGFRHDWGDKEIGLAGISKDYTRIFLADTFRRSEHENNSAIVIYLNLESKEEVNELYTIWKNNGANIVTVPESKPSGLHVFEVQDLDNNTIRVFYDSLTPEKSKTT